MTKEDLLKAVTDEYNVTADEMLSNSRAQILSEARQMLMYLLVDRMALKTIEIAAFVNRDHSTVVYAIKRITSLLEFDRITKKRYERITEKLKSL